MLRGGRGSLTLLLEGLVVRLLQPRLRTDVVAAGLEEFGKDDRAADGAGVGNVLAVGAVEAALVAAGGVDVGEEALVGVLVAEGPLPGTRLSRPPRFCSVHVPRLTHAPGG